MVSSLHQEGSVCNGALRLQLLLKSNWWMPLIGSQRGKDAVGSMSAMLKGKGIGSIECPGAGPTTMVFPQLRDLPHRVALNKAHHCFEPWVLIYKVRISGATAIAKSLQSCQTLCNPVPGILQARTLEWVAISFSNASKWKVKVKSLGCVRLLATPWTVAYQAPRSMGFSRQEYWSGVDLRCCGVQMQSGKNSGQHNAWNKGTDRWILGPTHHQKCKSPPEKAVHPE